ncbi:unnamed protein product, partial [Ectocarpus fasciculatus]
MLSCIAHRSSPTTTTVLHVENRHYSKKPTVRGFSPSSLLCFGCTAAIVHSKKRRSLVPVEDRLPRDAGGFNRKESVIMSPSCAAAVEANSFTLDHAARAASSQSTLMPAAAGTRTRTLSSEEHRQRGFGTL